MTTIVLQGGMKWGTTSMHSRTGVAGLLPLRHLGSTQLPPRPAIRLAMGLGFPRNLRTHPRREEPADGAVEVPRGARRQGLPRQGRRLLLERVSRGHLHRDDERRPGGAEPALGASARAVALLLL